MPYTHLTSTDNIDTLLIRMNNFAPYLPKITGEYANGTYDTFGQWKKSTPVNYAIYSDDNCVTLDFQLKALASAIETILRAKRGKPEYAQLEAESSRILLATYNAILNPTYTSCTQLHTIAKEVSGHGNAWAKVGVVLITVVGLLLGIFPGLFYLIYLDDRKILEKNSQQGLSLQADTIGNAIKHTGAPSTINSWSFFTPRREQFATDVAEIVVNDSAPPYSPRQNDQDIAEIVVNDLPPPYSPSQSNQ